MEKQSKREKNTGTNCTKKNMNGKVPEMLVNIYPVLF